MISNFHILLLIASISLPSIKNNSQAYYLNTVLRYGCYLAIIILFLGQYLLWLSFSRPNFPDKLFNLLFGANRIPTFFMMCHFFSVSNRTR